MQLFKLTLLGFVASLATARVAPTQTTRKISGVYTAEGLYSAPALETLKDNMDFIPTTKEDGFIDVFCDKKLAGPMVRTTLTSLHFTPHTFEKMEHGDQ